MGIAEDIPYLKDTLENKGYIKVQQDTVELRDKALRILRDEVPVISDENFREFYLTYPLGYGSRKFRTEEPKGSTYETLKDKYIKKVKTPEEHALVMRGLRREIASRTATGELQYMQLMKTYINNSTWELWQKESKTRVENILEEDA